VDADHRVSEVLWVGRGDTPPLTPSSISSVAALSGAAPYPSAASTRSAATKPGNVDRVLKPGGDDGALHRRAVGPVAEDLGAQVRHALAGAR